jgi:hypothetical protein
MKLTCKNCKKPLTKDLYPVKQGKSVYSIKRVDDDFFDHFFKEGVFTVQKKRQFCIKFESDEGFGQYQTTVKIPERICVAENSVLKGVIPPFKEGHGCCNWSFGEPLHCKCGNEIGQLYLDCYEVGKVSFIPKSVHRCY